MIRTKKSHRGGTKKWNDEMPDRAYRLALLGLTNREISIALNVAQATFDYWYSSHPDFRRSVLKGRVEADGKVALALYQRATGFTVKEEIIKVVDHRVVRIPVVKYYPPDVTAIDVWLRNRQSALWRTAYRHEVTGANGGPLEIRKVEDFSMDEFADNELDYIVEQAMALMNYDRLSTNHNKISEN